MHLFSSGIPDLDDEEEEDLDDVDGQDSRIIINQIENLGIVSEVFNNGWTAGTSQPWLRCQEEFEIDEQQKNVAWKLFRYLLRIATSKWVLFMWFASQNNLFGYFNKFFNQKQKKCKNKENIHVTEGSQKTDVVALSRTVPVKGLRCGCCGF